MIYQTRSESTGLQYHATLADAMRAASADDTIWKLSFTTVTGERIRLVRWRESVTPTEWVFEPIGSWIMGDATDETP